MNRGAGHVVHVVRSDSFSGVERYIADTAVELHERGWRVGVVGGDPARMRAELPSQVAHRPAATVVQVARQLAAIGRCDIVHAHMTAAELPAALLKRRTRGRLVVTRHFAAARGRSLAMRIPATFIRRQLDAQIAISRFVADAIGEPSTVIHNGVRPSSLVDVARARTVVVMQRLQPEKDTATALRAWAESGLADEGWRMEILGRGAERPRLQALATQLGIAASAQFAGFVADPRRRLAEASIMLAPAPQEPFGLAVVEAMAEGTPVIAAEGGAHRETLGMAGSYFRAGDVAACAHRLVELSGAPEQRVTLGAALRQRQLVEFSVHAHVTRLEEVYGA